MVKKRYCACGCGQEVKEGKRFVSGHFRDPKRGDKWTEERKKRGQETRKLKKALLEGELELPLCACGCGKKVTDIRNKYIRGHWKRGRTKENDARIRNNAKSISNGRLRFFKTEEGQKWLDEHMRGENNHWFGNGQWNIGLTKETHEGIRLGSIKTSETKRAFFQTEEGQKFKEKYYIGKTPWNAGLTKETDDRIGEISEILKGMYENGGRVVWNKGLTKEEDERLEGLAKRLSKTRLEFFKTEEGQKWLDKNLRGEKHPMFGKHYSEEVKKRMGDAQRGEKNGNYGKPTWKKGLTKETSEGVRKQSEALRKLWQDPKYIRKMIKAQNRKPNNFELKIESLLQNLFPDEYAYNGDFSLGIVIGGRIPDFVNVNGQKKVIEGFGAWWHKNDDDGNKVFHYRLYGFDCLVIWDYEFKDEGALVSKIMGFHKGV